MTTIAKVVSLLALVIPLVAQLHSCEPLIAPPRGSGRTTPADDLIEELTRLTDQFLDQMIRDTEQNIEIIRKYKLGDDLLEKESAMLKELKARKNPDRAAKIQELERTIKLAREYKIPEDRLRPYLNELDRLTRLPALAPAPRPKGTPLPPPPRVRD